MGFDDMPEDFAYLLAKALDDNRQFFRETLIPFSYDPRNVARDIGIPMRSGRGELLPRNGYLR